MRDVLILATRILVAVLLAAAWSGQACAQQFERGGGSTENDGFWFHSGGLTLVKDTPGVIFGMHRKPDSDREFAYVVLFKHRANAKSNIVTQGEVSDKDGKTDAKTRVVKMTDGIEIDDKKFGLTLMIEIDREKNAMKSEEFVFAGKKIDLKNGRVFLVDLTTEVPKWQQVEAKLPAKLPEPKELADVRYVVKRVLAELPKESGAIRAFLK